MSHAVSQPHGSGPLTPFKSCLGGNSKIPNVYWGALSNDQLRHNSSFVALPPVDTLRVRGHTTYRYVRQEHELWSALHAGVLTTSRLPLALGLREQGAASAIKGPWGRDGLQTAYAHLVADPWSPPPRDTPTSSGSSGSSSGSSAPGGGSFEEAEEEAHNEAVRALYNATLAASTSAAAAYCEDDKRRVSELLSLRGTTAVRLFWGTVQEPSSLTVMLQLFPHAVLEEVGMYCLGSERASEQYGVGRYGVGELPTLGASPDAVIRHRLAVTAGDVAEGCAVLREGAGAGGGDEEAGVGGGAHVGLAAWLRPAAGAGGGSRGGGEALLHSVAEAILRRALGGALQPQTAGGALTVGSSSSSSSDGSSGSSVGGGRGAGSNGLSLRRTWACSVREVADALRAAAADAGFATAAAAAAATAADGGSGSDASRVIAWVDVREAVEVKNHCPFAFKGQRKAKKGGLHLEYRMSDPGPMASVRPAWVPQLQMHCLATGVPSVLLLSRSASKGVRLYRVERDDAYIERMLDCLRLLQVEHVNPRRPPNSDLFSDMPGYADLLDHTNAIAKRASVVLDVAGSGLVAPRGTDANAFWEGRAGKSKK
ncbi:hypothetical protein FOA52_001355 [Chlamydomonas sp. UWO 241]|nr:hypothetical protein FOA52_001355 [Chlamydomonas sp. UWO 241]